MGKILCLWLRLRAPGCWSLTVCVSRKLFNIGFSRSLVWGRMVVNSILDGFEFSTRNVGGAYKLRRADARWPPWNFLARIEFGHMEGEGLRLYCIL